MPPTDQELRHLHDRYAGVVYHRALSILGEPAQAQDAVQETFARVIVHWESFRGEASPTTWMYRITTNWCLNQLRNRKGRAQKHVQHKDELGGEASAWMRDPVEATLVRDLLAQTDEQTRRIVVHTYFDDMTREEVAQVVGLSVPTVRKRLEAFIERARRLSGAALLAPVLAFVALALWGLV